MTQMEACKKVAESMGLILNGLGYAVTINFDGEIPALRDNLVKGMADTLGILKTICEATKIDPKALLNVPKQNKQGILLPGRDF